jgi:hypothetical protein
MGYYVELLRTLEALAVFSAISALALVVIAVDGWIRTAHLKDR